MKRIEAIELNEALNKAELKVKFLSSEKYVKLIKVKRTLVKYLDDMAKDEKILFKDFDILSDKDLNHKMIDDKGFRDKLNAIQDKEFKLPESPFMNEEDLKKFTDEADFRTGSIIAEHLLIC